MAHIAKLPSGSWRAIVTRGKRQSRTFACKADAELWAARIEADLEALKAGRLPRRSLAEAMLKYADEVSPSKGGAHWEDIRLRAWAKQDWARKVLSDVSTADMAQRRDARLKEVSAGTVLREFNLLGAVFTLARKEWGWITDSPLKNLSMPREPAARTQRVSDAEVSSIVTALGGYGRDTKSQEVAIAFSLCVETAMRRGEALSLTWANISGRTAFLPRTKNGEARTVPLSKVALRLLDILHGKNVSTVFSVSNSTADALFRVAKKRVGLSHIHFHDSRREALTRLAKKLKDPLLLAKISGHKDMGILLRTYFSPDMDDVAAGLD